MNATVQDLPPAVDPAGWTPGNLASSSDWVHALSEAETGKLLALGEGDSRLAGDGALYKLMEATAAALRSGTGFRIIRGVPVERLGAEGSERVFLALGRHIGTPMVQPGGVRVGHVRVGRRPAGTRPGARWRKGYGFLGARQMPFHADLEDAIGFLCIRPAAEGGLRRIASAVTVWNVMREECPDLLRTLTRPFHMALTFPHPEHGCRWTRLPFLSVRDGTFNACAYRLHIRQAQRMPDVPKLSAGQDEALEAFNDIADRVSIPVELGPGDLEYFNNHVILHSRTRFRDEQPGRHLLRIWLSIPGFRTVHEEHPINLRTAG